ncbi:MAG: zinc carboxypeptidase [Flavobacteriaceae bacterium]|nr:MAG: zinc carboxypeptidase [Flavobacteriaceae bacterium]
MNKTHLLLFVSLFFGWSVFSQTLKSPEEYLGTPIGTKFHFHHQLISYVEYVAANKPENVKIHRIGYTTEGRPQMVVAIGSKENIQNLERIRQSNLQNIGLMPGQGNKNIPTIAYLSYNVHGNESVNAETSVKVIYELAAENSELVKKVLKNTIILIDPCVNPDGFDRYSQWYNRYLGQKPDLHAASVEHHEPWPGGRFNHYLFDLNRDVAWQTQKESQQRVSFYNSWMPHLHADFHEMGPNSTYYFPPSAKPFHEDLTGFQREFQETLGQYNKRAFDQNGWLYFTKENYDLFYPSYGDTYPSYNGAIAMTFEQGGGGPAGLAYKRKDGDTLTLKDRIQHSFSTSLGTLEALSDKSEKTKEEFYKFFNDAQNKGYGKYKSYIMKFNGHEAKIKALTEQLDKLHIEYSFANKKLTANGLSYQNQKEESFGIDENDLLVNTYQAKGVLTKILFEPKPYLEDSNTYDITAWALPYAFDLPTFASSQKLSGTKTKPNFDKKTNLEKNQRVFAFVSEIKSFEESRFLAQLFKENIKIRIQETPFKASGKSFGHGTLLITRKGNEGLGENFEKKILSIAQNYDINLLPLTSGMVESGPDLGSGSVDVINPPKVGLIIGAGVSPTAAGDIWHFMDQQLQYPVTLIDGSYFSRIDLWTLDVLILPDGQYNQIVKDHKEILRWVSDGGRVILLEDANNFLAGKEGIELKPKTDSEEKESSNKIYGSRERDAISDQIPGAIYKINLDNSHPLAYGYDKNTSIIVKNKLGYEYLKNGWNVGTLGEHQSGFVGQNLKKSLKNVPVFAIQEHGNGKIIHMLESPIFRAFWFGGKLMMANAVFLVR